jgi:hypothetical protein
MLAALPRIGTSPITSKAAFFRRLEDLAFELGDLREEAVAQKRDDWWRLADVLDDVMDMLDALKHPADQQDLVTAPFPLAQAAFLYDAGHSAVDAGVENLPT